MLAVSAGLCAPYLNCRRLGISADATFEEVQEARNFLYEVSQHLSSPFQLATVHLQVQS